MVRCQRSVGSWCLFSKWCPCYCSKRQASVGCKYTLFPCMIPLSKRTFQTFGCLLSNFFLLHYISPSFSPSRLLHWNKTNPSNSCNNPFRRKQNFLYTQLSLQSYLLLFAYHQCPSVTWMMWKRQQLTFCAYHTAKCFYLPPMWNCELE